MQEVNAESSPSFKPLGSEVSTKSHEERAASLRGPISNREMQEETWSNTISYPTPGSFQFTVPDRVSSLRVELAGAMGGTTAAVPYVYGYAEGISEVWGGYGCSIVAILPVSPGETYYLFVGSTGDEYVGGYNGGGAPFPVGKQNTGGGGATDIRSSPSLADRLIVAGGGGGASGYCMAAMRKKM